MRTLLEGLAQADWRLIAASIVGLLCWFLFERLVRQSGAARAARLFGLLDLLLLPGFFLLGTALALRLALELGAGRLEEAVVGTGTLLVYLSLAFSIARVMDLSLSLGDREALGERVPKLIIGLIYAGFLFFGLALFLWQEGYSFAGVWVSTGVAAAVLGLALQKTLGDLFSGIALGVERPFRIGDWLELSDGTLGQVMDLNWRATHLRGWDNSVQVIPNSKMAGEKIKNYCDEQHLYAPWYFVQIPAEVDPRFATALLLDAAMRCESVLKVPNPIVRLADATSIPYSYMVWVHMKNYPSMFRAREELYREIHRGLQEAGIEIAPLVQEWRTRRAKSVAAEPPTISLALQSLEFTGELGEAELARMSAGSEYRYYNTGHVLVAEGAVSDAFYVIAGGLVEMAIRLPDGSRKVIDTLGPGKHFGLTAMLTTEPSFLEYSAKTDVTLIRIDLSTVQALIAERPELAGLFTSVIKDRLDAAEAARIASRRPARRLSLREIRRGFESRMRGSARPLR